MPLHLAQLEVRRQPLGDEIALALTQLRWAVEHTWRAEAAKDDARRGILEQLGASVDDALAKSGVVA